MTLKVRVHQGTARLRRAGIEVTDAGKARWRDRLAAPIPPEALAEGQRILDEAA
ncbi:hypothetical protein [Salinispora sp. H7-4]|uniref:hypothetical protein n=1 Tax=Salinispora sp. H7-4 TaxID=2748321 RepID=UPI0015D0EE09|nr:hypothetical protein [Salinispora sp. H7-4]NYT96439.1 hypothetical protein [Salinispora sp. H7-4]